MLTLCTGPFSVPQSLLKEADPSSFQTTSVPNQNTKKGDRTPYSSLYNICAIEGNKLLNYFSLLFIGEHPVIRSSKFAENRIIVSNSLMAYGYITGNLQYIKCLKRKHTKIFFMSPVNIKQPEWRK